jgi:hypothetical protein
MPPDLARGPAPCPEGTDPRTVELLWHGGLNPSVTSVSHAAQAIVLRGYQRDAVARIRDNAGRRHLRRVLPDFLDELDEREASP